MTGVVTGAVTARDVVDGVQRAVLVTQRSVEGAPGVSPGMDRELRRMALLHRRDMARRRRDLRRRRGAVVLARS